MRDKSDTAAFRETFRDLGGMPEPALRELLEPSSLVELPAGTLVYSEGDACSAIAFIIEGLIRVFKTAESGREITLYEILPGETCILNASCILSGGSYPANAQAVEDTRALLIPSDVFASLVPTPELGGYVHGLLSRRLTGMMELVEEVAFGRVDRRLADYLVERSESGILKATHQHIANDLGSSREVISRLLKDMERKGRVRLERNTVHLIDR